MVLFQGRLVVGAALRITLSTTAAVESEMEGEGSPLVLLVACG
jgi:hypothetical protein